MADDFGIDPGKPRSTRGGLFRPRRAPVDDRPGDDLAAPFTEIPRELFRPRFLIGDALRKVFNVLLLLVLAAALVGLIFAFAYQMIYNPDTIAELGARIAQVVNDWTAWLISLLSPR